MKKLLLLLCLSSPLYAQTMYRWIDAEGTVHYSNQPPPAGAKAVEEKKLRPSTAGGGEMSYATREAMKNFPVVFYSTDCGDPCANGRELLAKRGVPYIEKNPQTPEASAELKQLIEGELVVPVLKVGRTVLRGFESGQWHSALDTAGYPKSASYKPPAQTKTPAELPAASEPPTGR